MIFDELNQLTTSKLDSINLTNEKEVDDAIYDLLVIAYAFGQDYADEIIGWESKRDINKINDSIYKKVKGENYTDRVKKWLKADNIDLTSEIRRICDTETTRVYNEAILEVAKENSDNIKKRWRTMEDEKVRDSHYYLDGVTIELDEEFTTFDGDSAQAPGGFEMAQNNVNCRCLIELVKEQ